MILLVSLQIECVFFFFGNWCMYTLLFAGYRMKIDDKDDKPNTGRLHIDFAQARDDLHEWECVQRQMMRDSRHRYRIEDSMFRPPSPPATVHYSDHEAMMLIDSLKGSLATFCDNPSTEFFIKPAHFLLI